MASRFVPAIALGIGVLVATGVSATPAKYQHHAKRHVAWRGHHTAPGHYAAPRAGWNRGINGDGWVFEGPGYTFVPGRGIIDEDCDLPTSACLNTQRIGG